MLAKPFGRLWLAVPGWQKFSVASHPRKMMWFVITCLALASEPPSAMGRQMPPTLSGQIGHAVPVAVPGQHDVYDYLGSAGGPIELPRLGIIVRNGSATLNNGQRVSGALVAEVSSTGPAAKALNSHHPSRIILEGALFGMAVASAVFFPPAAVGVTTIACYVADSYDLVIAVDGRRVKNTLELAELLEDEQSGDMIYLVILRKGRRLQVAIQIR